MVRTEADEHEEAKVEHDSVSLLDHFIRIFINILLFWFTPQTFTKTATTNQDVHDNDTKHTDADQGSGDRHHANHVVAACVGRHAVDICEIPTIYVRFSCGPVVEARDGMGVPNLLTRTIFFNHYP